MKKELLVISLLLIISVGFVLYCLFKPSNTLKYNGIQIYDAIKKYNLLFSCGFDINVTIIGRDYSGDVELSGTIAEVEEGYFILQINNTYFRIIEGLMGAEDVQAREIYLQVSKPIVVEIVIPPVKSFTQFSDMLKEYERIRCEFAVVTNKTITPLIIQRLRNLGTSFYNIPNVEVEQYDNGFAVIIRKPIKTSDLLKIMNSVNEELQIENFESNYLFLYKGIENEGEINEIKESGIGLVRAYRI